MSWAHATRRPAAHFPTFVGHWLLKGGNAVSRQFRKAMCTPEFLWAIAAAGQKRGRSLSFLGEKERRRASRLAYYQVPEQMISSSGIPMKGEWCLEQETRYLALGIL